MTVSVDAATTAPGVSALTRPPALPDSPEKPDQEPPARVDQDWERRRPTAHEQRADLMTGVLLAIGTVASTELTRRMGLDFDGLRPGRVEEGLWALAVALPLCLRRRYPLLVLVVSSIAFIGMQSQYGGEGMFSSICLFLALYTAGAWGRNRRITGAVRVIVVVTMFCWLAYSVSSTVWFESTDTNISPNEDEPPGALTASVVYLTFINVLFFVAAWAFGNAAWLQARQSAELAERNLELQVERDANARRAVIAERVRIARELHDVVAHHVSVMGVQAGAARRVLATNPALAEQTLTSVEAAGRSAVEEMRRLLGVLREGDLGPESLTDRTPAPGLDQIAALVNEPAEAGLAREFTVVGTPRIVPQSISVSLYRIVQEALTNTVRHAGATRVDVRLRYLEQGVEVEIVDNGRGRPFNAADEDSLERVGTGLGHVGMRERVAMHGGLLEVGPRSEGGYRVRARFPTR